jgi:hypothetical protein
MEAKILGISFGQVPTGAIIPFEAARQLEAARKQFSEFPHNANLATNMEAAESPLLFPIPVEGGETSIVKCGGADC